MKRQWKIKSFLVFATFVAVFLGCLAKAPTVMAANPTTMNFQGKVVNANGTNVTDGSYTFVFKLYTATTGGSAIWTGTQSSVSVTAGVFQVDLGSVCPFFTANACNNNTPIDFNANPNLYLGITFNSDPAGEMTPRVQLQSVPFAYNADRVGGLSVSQLVQISPGSQQSGFINVSGTINGATLSGGTISGGTLTGTAVNSLNVSGTAISGSGAGLAVSAGGVAQVLKLDGATTGKIQIGSISSGDIELASQGSGNILFGGGSGGSGCMITNSNGSFLCDGTINGATLSGGTISGGSLTSAAVNNLNVSGTAISGNGTGLAVSAGGTAQVLKLDGATTGKIQIGSISSGDVEIAGQGSGNVLLGGGTGGSGCTFTNSNGNFFCDGDINTSANLRSGGTIRLDNTGNLSNIGNLTMVGTLGVTGNINTTNGNILIQQTAAGASAIFDDVAGKIGSIKAGSAKVAFLFDNTGNFSIGSDSRTNIMASNTAGTDVLTILGASGNVGIGDSTPVATFTVGSGDLFQIAGATGTVSTSGGYIQSGTVANILTGATSLTAAGTALSVTNAASVGTLVVTSTGASGITGSGALSISAGGTAQNITLNGATTGQVQIGGTSTGDILLGGGSSSTGCTVTNASGNLACTATITTATFNATTSYQANGTPGTTVAACTAAQYLGNGVAVIDGLVTAGTCRTDATGISDSRLKQNISALNPASALDTLNQLRPVSYEFNDLYHEVTGDNLQYGTQYGFVAQEVLQVMPGLVNADLYGQSGYYGIDYHAFYGLLTASVQELSRKIDTVTNDNLSDGIITPSLVSVGALMINSGTSGNVSIDSGNSSAQIDIGTITAGLVNISRNGQVTNIGGALVIDEDSNFGGDVTMDFNGSQGLHITSDLKGTMTGISFTATPSAIDGRTTGVLIKQAESTGTSGLDDALVIDNVNTSLPIDTAIQISNSGGGGYNNLIRTPNFSVSGTGDLAATSITSRGSLQIIDATGQQVISFDSTGNANFNGNLNLASASLTGGLSVAGDANFAGLTTFQKVATFLGKTIFRQDVEFDGHVTVGGDSAGYASLRAGETTVHVDLTVPYATPPVVSAAFTDGHFASYTVVNVGVDGFDISLKEPASEPMIFSWTAIGVNNPRTATNPLPANP